jgi:Ca2+-binding RTX toxin-like protein
MVVALPARAITTCSTVGPILTIHVETDDRIIVTNAGGTYFVLEDGQAAQQNCGPADFIDIVGADNGQETVVLFAPQTMAGDNLNVDLGNGNDSLILEYGDTVWNNTGGPTNIPDPATNDAVAVGAGPGGTSIVNFNAGPGGTSADLWVLNAENFTINGGAGTDVVNAGLLGQSIATSSTVPATTVDDIPGTTTPASANLVFNGESGQDAFISGNGNDAFNGGADADTVSFQTASQGVTVDLQAGTGTGQGSDSLTDVQSVQGSDFDDTIAGSSIDNVLVGNDGNDTISGLAGNDQIQGSDGDDTLSGGDGNDQIQGNNGDDTVDEGAAANGADILSGGADSDTLNYSARTTSVAVNIDAVANDGEDTNGDGVGEEGDLVGPDFETYLGGSAADSFVGGPGNETFQPNGGDDFVDGGGGVNVLDTSESDTDTTVDLPNGTDNGDGNDTFTNIQGAMTGGGNDTVLMDDTTGVLFNFAADGGHDTVDASATTIGVTINLALYGSGLCQPNCEEVEDAIGGSGDDAITGTSQTNNLWGGDGEDVINAGLGNDFVEGGLGNDTLNDGGGFDTLSYRNAASGEQIDTANGFASGGDGDDQLNGGWEEVQGSDFDDTITGGQTSFDAPNRLKGFKGNDLIFGTDSTDTIAGGKGNDELRAGRGDDIVKGSGGNDLLVGSSGDDVLKGGNGNDELQGGKGFDTGNGGKGSDFCNGVEHAKSC